MSAEGGRRNGVGSVSPDRFVLPGTVTRLSTVVFLRSSRSIKRGAAILANGDNGDRPRYRGRDSTGY